MDFAILLYVQPLARNLLARAVLDSVTQNRKMMGKVRRTRRATKVNEMVAMICERRVRELKGDQWGPLTGGGARSSDLEPLLPTKPGQEAPGCDGFSGGFLA